MKVLKADNDAEVRRNAVISLTKINISLGVLWLNITRKDYESIIECYIRNLCDYTIDTRGDVGSWIREVCMVGCYDIVKIMLQYHPEYSSNDLNTGIIAHVLKQSVEKIDRTRDIAGSVLMNFFTNMESSLFDCSNSEILRELIKR